MRALLPNEETLHSAYCQGDAERLKRNFRAYIRDAWHIVEPATPFKPNWHIDAIAEHLEAATRGEIRRLVVNIPPRHMKSLEICVFWPTWLWTRDPAKRFLTASYGQELAIRDAVKSRRLIQSAWYQRRFAGAFTLTSDQNVKGRYENDKRGYRLATSVGGTATGEGGDIILIDDPHKADEVESDVERQNVLDWHDGTISTRFNDPAHGIEVLVMQRLHELDLTGHVLEQGGWTHLCLPAEYEPKHPFVWPDDPREEPGELLWPGHFTRAALAELKNRLGSYRAAGQLQQRPAPQEGGIFKLSNLRYFDPTYLEPPSPLVFTRIVQSWDTAMKEKTQNDYCVGTVWGVAGANRYLLRETRERMATAATIRAMRELHRWVEETYPRLPHTVLIENRANGPEVYAALRDELAGLVRTNPDTDKVTRALSVEPIWESGNVFVPGFALPDGSGFDAARTPAWVQEWIAEHTSFPNGAHKDRVDTTTQVLSWLRGVRDMPPDRREESSGPREAVTAGLYDRTF